MAQTWITRVNDSQADNLGLSSSALPLLRDLIHERTGVFFDNGRYDALRDRLAPLVVDRGFDSFLDYYYLLKYDEGGGSGLGPASPTRWRCPRPTSGGRWIRSTAS